MIQKLLENRITEESVLPKMDFLYQLFGTPCFPRGELVAVAGKAKSGKTFFLSLLMAMGVIPEKEPTDGKAMIELKRGDNQPLNILWYDTEQSQQLTQDILVNRMMPMVETDGRTTLVKDHIYAFNVRTFGWEERLKMFQAAIPYLKPDLVVLDGVRDLISDINDGKEAQLIIEQLMALAQKHWCCIVCVLHQNKADLDHNLRGWIGTELTNKVFEVYSCEVTADRTFKVKQTHTRKQAVGRELYYQVDTNTQLPVVAEGAVASQPRDARGRWVSQSAITDLRKLFTEAMEGRSQRPKRELMAVAMKKCGVEDAKTYYGYFGMAEQQGIIRKSVHPTTGEEWIELTENPLFP